MEFRYFSKSADPDLFFCSHTGLEGIQPRFVRRLDQLRHVCGFPFVITSGFRHETHPIEAAKNEPGTHSEGIAADIRVRGGAQRRLLVWHALNLGFNGIGVARTFVHVDIRDDVPVLWVYS